MAGRAPALQPNSLGHALVCHSYLWTSCFTLLCLSFPIYKMRMTTINRTFSRSCHED